MDWLGLSLVLVLYLLILLLALLATRGSSDTAEDLMLAGRGLGLFVGVSTLVATEVGGAFVNGTAEEVSAFACQQCTRKKTKEAVTQRSAIEDKICKVLL